MANDDELLKLKAELAFYKGFHDGVCNTGTHVMVPVEPNATLLKAMEDARWGTPNWRHTTAYDAYKAMIKAAKEGGNAD